MKKKRKNFKRLIGYSATIGTAGLLAGKLPASAATPTRTIATTGSKFIAPLAAATGAGIVMNSLKKLRPKKGRKK